MRKKINRRLRLYLSLAREKIDYKQYRKTPPKMLIDQLISAYKEDDAAAKEIIKYFTVLDYENTEKSFIHRIERAFKGI